MIDKSDMKQLSKKRFLTLNVRKKALSVVVITSLVLLLLPISYFFIGPESIALNFSIKNNKPSLSHIFGTDWLGRDMFSRTLKGLTLSLSVGLLAASISTFIALALSLIASINKRVDAFVTWLIDLFLSVPHIVTLILISFALGGGVKGVVIGIALTHWPSLTRLLRAEMLQIKNTDYVALSKKMGKSNTWIAIHHITPHLMPQLIIGFILLFPHAILHEAAITFLGFGLSAEQPAIGIILSESMQYLSKGMWWLAFFPGLLLLIMVSLFEMLGRNIRLLLNPFYGQRL